MPPATVRIAIPRLVDHLAPLYDRRDGRNAQADLARRADAEARSDA